VCIVPHGLKLPQTPVGKTYQLWAIAHDKPVSIGVFNVDDRGNKIMKLGTLPEGVQVQKFAVTLEPAGGVPLPTGDMYLAGDSK
jgi:anti-sigma-K factor RskA